MDLPINPSVDALQRAGEIVLRTDGGFVDMFHVEDGGGAVLAVANRSMEGLVGIMEIIVASPAGEFLLAFRLKNRPGERGQPLVQVNIPYFAVDDQGHVVGELRGRFNGLAGRSYALWSQGEEYLSVPSASRSEPYPVLQRGAPVALVTEKVSLFAKPVKGSWTVRFSAPCQHLDVLALVTHVAAHRGNMGMAGG
jgi:hypothetical protein